MFFSCHKRYTTVWFARISFVAVTAGGSLSCVCLNGNCCRWIDGVTIDIFVQCAQLFASLIRRHWLQVAERPHDSTCAPEVLPWAISTGLQQMERSEVQALTRHVLSASHPSVGQRRTARYRWTRYDSIPLNCSSLFACSHRCVFISLGSFFRAETRYQ